MHGAVNAIVMFWCVISVTSCAGGLAPSITIGVRSGKAQLVSPIRLIAEPQAYDGQQVFVGGVLRYEFESRVLYLSMEDYAWRRSWNAIRVRFSEAWSEELLERLSGRQVLIEGRFVAEREVDWLNPNGVVESVVAIESWDRVR